MRENKQASKIKTIVISIVVAILVWAAVTYINPPVLKTTISNLPIRFTGVEELRDRGLTVVDKADIPSLSVVVKGKKNDLLALSGGVFVEVDVSTVSEDGEYNLTGNVTLPSSVLTIDSVKFNSVPVRIEEISSKDIPIKVLQTGSISGKLAETVPEDEYITITGAVSEINSVAYGAANIDISKVSDGTIIDSGYILMNRNDEPINRNETISASKTSIKISCSIYNAVTLPIHVVLSDTLSETYIIDYDGTVVTPSSVEVGLKDDTIQDVLMRINSVEDLNGGLLEEADGMYIPENSRRVKLKADLKKKVVKNLTVNVNAGNLASGLTANISPVSMTVSGAEEDIKAENIIATVDLSEFGAGVYTVPVIIDCQKVSVSGEYETEVTIS